MERIHGVKFDQDNQTDLCMLEYKDAETQCDDLIAPNEMFGTDTTFLNTQGNTQMYPGGPNQPF